MNIKICGLVQPRDAELALELGATHVGCVVAPDSPRSVSFAARQAIRELARGRAHFVLVVRDLGLTAVRALARDCEPDRVQCHGLTEDEERDLAGDLPLLRVRQVDPAAARLPAIHPSVDAPFVLDGGRGGAGQRFPWSLLAAGTPEFTFIAGGITPDTLPELLAFRPWGIDVSSGIEQSAGQKDHGAMRALFAGLDRAREVKR